MALARAAQRAPARRSAPRRLRRVGAVRPPGAAGPVAEGVTAAAGGADVERAAAGSAPPSRADPEDAAKAAGELAGLAAAAVIAGALIGAVLAPLIPAYATATSELVAYGASVLPLIAAERLNVVGWLNAYVGQRVATLCRAAGAFEWQVSLATSAVDLIARLARAVLYFTIVTVAVEAVVPDTLVLSVPKQCAFFIPKSAVTGDEIEDLVFGFTSKVLNAWLSISVAQFMLKAKQPPPDSRLTYDGGPIARYLLAVSGGLKGSNAQYAGIPLLIDRILTLMVGGFALVNVAAVFGISLKAIAAVAGVGALAISFAARPLVENVISALLIFVTNPFSVNEVIDAKSVKGVVTEIGWVNTTIETQTGSCVVPNRDLCSQSVINKSRVVTGALSVPIVLVPTLPGGEDIRGAVISATGVLKNHASVSRDGPQVCVFNGTTDDGKLKFTTKFMLGAIEASERDVLTSNVLVDVYSVMGEHGLSASKE